MVIKKTYEILKILLKDLSSKHTITSLALGNGISRVGVWKLMQNLKKRGLIIPARIGIKKNSIQELSLNWQNPITEKVLSLLLTEDSLKQNKWRFIFKKLEQDVKFLILFGSILHSPKEANDIDILCAVLDKNRFVKIDKKILEIQLTQDKKIHSFCLTSKELKQELAEKNKVYIDALKKGVILFGQDNFINFMKEENGRKNF